MKILEEILDLAKQEQSRIEKSLPADPLSCLGLFVETVRVLDYIMLGQPGVPKQDKMHVSVFDLNMIEMGWNLAGSMLLKSGNFFGFPMRQSTDDLRKMVMSILYQLGIIAQLRRTVEMMKAGLVNVKKSGSTYTFSQTIEAKDQFLDELEFGALDELEKKLKSSVGIYKDWELVDRNAMKDVFWQVGNFLSVKYNSELAAYKTENIDSLMIPLIKKWDSGNYGIMMGYDSTPEIDNHFLAIATELTAEWRDEAGIHPNTKIGNISAADIMAVAIMIISFHIKHIHFVQLASEKEPEILIPQSLSIWNPVHELIKDLSEFSGIKQEVVEEAINAITLKPSDGKFLKKHSTRFRPLLIDIGSGFVLRSVSCVLRNPLHSVYALMESRDSALIDRISRSREEWFRCYLYAMFAGTRYQKVVGNIKIRKDGKILTDIDAVIYDNLTGELALFQLKWQNYFTNDVRKLRSRAINFVTEINRWTEKIDSWLSNQDILNVIKSLRIKGATDKLTKSKIYLFGLGKTTARTHGYGYPLNNERIAVSNWAQLLRNRTKIGPASHVISELFQNLKVEENAKVESRPMPVKIPFAGIVLDFKDIWSIVNDECHD